MIQRSRLLWQVFQDTSRARWWLVVALVNVIIYSIQWITRSVPQWLLAVDGMVLLSGSIVILVLTFARYRRAATRR